MNKTFRSWYQGNIADDAQPIATDGRIMVNRTAIKSKVALRVVSKPAPIGSRYMRQHPSEEALASAFRQNMLLNCRLAFMTGKVRTEGTSQLDYLEMVHTSSTDGQDVQEAWFNQLALHWLLDHVSHDYLHLNDRGALLAYHDNRCVAILMPVNIPSESPRWVSKLRDLATV